MRDRGIILTGLVLFLGLITAPAWYNLARGATSRGPELKLPATEKQCVAPTAWMRAWHMDLLVSWREQVVREGNRSFRAADGRLFNASLTGTCLMRCHTVKADFCDRCHNYAAVKGPYCWDCHVDPRLVKPLAAVRAERLLTRAPRNRYAALTEARPSGSAERLLTRAPRNRYAALTEPRAPASGIRSAP